ERACVQLVQPNDIVETTALDLLASLVEHLRRQVDAGQRQVAAIAGQRQAGADADLQHAALAAVDDLDGVLPASLGDLAKGEIVDRRPAAIRGAYGGGIHHSCS